MSGLEVVVRCVGKPTDVVPLGVGTITVGRAEDNGIVLADIGVSRTHASLTLLPGEGVEVRDLDSGNGTFVAGRPIVRPEVLGVGDVLRIDPFVLEIRRAEVKPMDPVLASSAQTVTRLDVLRGPNLAQGSYTVPAHGLSIGRSEYRDVVVLDPAASRHHCDIVREDDTWRLKDRGSSNGVHLNEERVQNATLANGDILRIGNTELRFVHVRVGQRGDAQTAVPTVDDERVGLNDATPQAAALRAHTSDDPTDPDAGVLTTQPRARSGVWMVALATASVGLAAAAILVLIAAVVVAQRPARPSVPLHASSDPLPPSWTLDVASPPPGTVDDLFTEGVDAMRQGRSKEALRAFHRILQLEPGNRAAERWSYTAGEHLMLEHMESRLDARVAEREADEAARDELIERLPRRDAIAVLEARFRDDPIVLTRMGWKPSASEAELARELDTAFIEANGGDHASARDRFDSVLKRTRNLAVEERARFGRTATRRELAAKTAMDWRAGVEAEMRADLDAARAAYRRVLAVDQRNPSARVRLGYLGSGPDDRAEARR